MRKPLRRGGVLVGEFGNKFRKEREKKSITLEEVSNATKISSRMLLAIEDEQFDRLPGGVFNKGFIRAYAKHIGLNEDQAVADYLAYLRQSQQSAQDVWDPQAGPVVPSGAQPRTSAPKAEELPELQLPRAEHVSPPRRDYAERREHTFPWRIVALAVLVVVLAVLLWHRHWRREAAATPSAAPTTQLAPQPLSTAAETKPAATKLSPTAPAPTSTRPLAPKTASALNASFSRPLNPPPAQPAIAPETNSSNDESADLAARSDQSLSPVATANPESSAAPLTLVIRASENSWISVTADGRSVLHELLIAPAHVSIRAGHEILVKVGNAAGVTFLWNGQELPSQGAEAEVKTLAFDAVGMRIVPPSPPADQNP